MPFVEAINRKACFPFRADDEFIKKNLYANVDYYSAIALYTIGIPMDQFTPLFAVARVPGWCAHVIEQWADNRLIRPDVEYVGPMNKQWIPMENRNGNAALSHLII